jgi:hypothetical protein
MPIQVATSLPGKPAPIRKTVTLSWKSNSFVIPVDAAPTTVVLDPEKWVLMDAAVVGR